MGDIEYPKGLGYILTRGALDMMRGDIGTQRDFGRRGLLMIIRM